MQKIWILLLVLLLGVAAHLPAQDTALVAEVRRLGEAGDYAALLPVADEALKSCPDSAVLYFYKGIALSELGQADSARVAFSTSIELEPWMVEAFLERARAHYSLGQTDAALKDLRHCLKEDPAYLEALLLRAEILLDQGDFPGALDDLERARRLAPKEVQVYCLRAEVYWSLGDITRALKDANYAVRLAPADPMPYITRANAHMINGALTAALADADKAIELAPEVPSLLNTRAFVHMEMDDLKAAHADLDLYLAKDSLAYDAYLTRALLHERAGLLDSALVAVLQARALLPDDPGIETQLGFLLLRLGKDSAAIEVLEPVLEQHPSEAFALSALGLAHAHTGATTLGLKELDRAIKLDDADPRAYFHRALVYFQLDKKEKGCADLDAAELRGFNELYNADELSAARDLNCGK
jgi:tetratricopeptide (TPR) repeat protein